jgi:hypothetical protein
MIARRLRTSVTIIALSIAAAAFLMTGCGGSLPGDDNDGRDVGTLPVNCASSAACTQ